MRCIVLTLSNGKLRISMRPENKQAVRELLVMTLLGMLVIIGVAVPVMSIVAFVFCAAMLVFTDLERAFCLTFFLVPFATVFKYALGATSLFTYLEILLVLKVIAVNSRGFDKRFLIGFLLFAVYVVVGANLEVTTIIKQLIIPLLIYGFFRSYRSGIKKVLLYFTFGLLLSSTFAQFMDQITNLEKYIILDQAYITGETVDRLSGLYSDPNYYSLALMMAITGLLTLYVNKQMGNLSLVLVVALIAFGAQTVSKSFLLMLSVVLALFVGLLFYRKRYLISLVSLIIIFVLFVAVLSGEIEIFNNIIERLISSGRDTESLTTGRTFLWGRYIEEIFGDNFFITLFGRGISADYPMRAGAAHNTYLDFLYYYGFVGSILFGVVCSLACPKQANSKQYNVNMFSWCVLLVMVFFLSYLLFFDFVFMLILAILSFREGSNKA